MEIEITTLTIKMEILQDFFLLFVWSYTMYTFSPASHPLRNLPPAFFSPASRTPSASYSPGFPPCCPAHCPQKMRESPGDEVAKVII